MILSKFELILFSFAFLGLIWVVSNIVHDESKIIPLPKGRGF